MSKHFIQIGVHLNEDLGITSATIDHNTTKLESNSELLRLISIALLKSIYLNKEDLQFQELLSELNITKAPNSSEG